MLKKIVIQTLLRLNFLYLKLLEEISRLQKMIDEEPRPTLYPEGPFLNCMSRDHILVELKYTRAAIAILRDPQKQKKLGGYFYINFGSRHFDTKI